jgi:hypothetical protein
MRGVLFHARDRSLEEKKSMPVVGAIAANIISLRSASTCRFKYT